MEILDFLTISNSQTLKNLESCGYRAYKKEYDNNYFDVISMSKKYTNSEGVELFGIFASFRSYARYTRINELSKNNDAMRFLDFDMQINPTVCAKTTLQVSTVQQFNRFFNNPYVDYDDVEISVGEIKKVEKFFEHLFEQLCCAAYEDYTVFEITDDFYINSLDKEPNNIKNLNFSTILKVCKSKGLPIEKIAELFESENFELIAQLLFG
jgi:hypothetical protein